MPNEKKGFFPSMRDTPQTSSLRTYPIARAPTPVQIDAALKAKIALEALREQATVTDLVQRYQIHPNQIYARKKQLLEVHAFENDNGDGAAEHERELERLYAMIGQLIVERDFLAKRFGR
jgi:transposase